ncbi:12323_t:CDS:2 [Funneliformis geosporum]|nr:12323_t:CDS:2 [Funneliformis geosporum]
MLQYLCSDATPLSAKDIQDIIKAKNSTNRALEVMVSKYKISTWRVYQIWRGAHPLIDPKDIKSLSEEPGSYQQANPPAELCTEDNSQIQSE